MNKNEMYEMKLMKKNEMDKTRLDIYEVNKHHYFISFKIK